MKQNMKFILKIFSFLLLLIFFVSCQQSDENNVYYAVEINGTTCGYSEVTSKISNINDRPCKLLTEKVHVILKLMETGVSLDFLINYYIDTVTFKICKIDYNYKFGDVEVSISTIIHDDTIFYSSNLISKTKKIVNYDSLIIERPLENPYLLMDFINGNAEEKIYDFFDVRKGEIIEKVYKRKGFDTVEVSGKEIGIVKLTEFNKETGEKAELWIDFVNGQTVKAIYPSRTVYLTDRSVMKRIKLGKMDEVLFYKMNEIITDASAIKYMKVKAQIEALGEVLNPGSLNVRGQKFSGSVEDNFIDGVFEISHMAYKGHGAPQFPVDYSGNDSLEKYLLPEEFIESDNEVLIAKSDDITEGSATSWEAALRMAMWVSDYLDYGIPGGTSAYNTFKTRMGECGGHSRLLVALCRAAGIPARLSVGCVYANYDGGTFGQHAWTEVFMGDTGWIPIDATAGEYENINSTHIRLGEKTSFRPKYMEILDYKLESEERDTLITEIHEKYKRYTGKYKNPKTGNIVEVYFRNNLLTVELPDKIILELNDPDEEGFWYSKRAGNVNFSFYDNENGFVDVMWIQEIVPFKKTKEKGYSYSSDIPAEFGVYTGVYKQDMMRAKFVVNYKEDRLEILNSLNKTTKKFALPGENGKIQDPNKRDAYKFMKNDEGKITHVNYYHTTVLSKLADEHEN